MIQSQRELREGLSDICYILTDVLQSIRKGFNNFDMAALDDADDHLDNVSKRENDIVIRIKGSEKERNDVKAYLSILGHSRRIADNLLNMIYLNRKKLTEDILFSDRAIDEINGLFEKVGELLEFSGDTLLTGNRVLMNHILENAESLDRKVEEFADSHQRRLVTGFCIPKASPIYLEMLGTFKEIGRLFIGISLLMQGIKVEKG